MKPIIGILAEVDDSLYCGVKNTYVSAIEDSGGLPMLIPYVKESEAISDSVSLCDGLFFTGGVDVDPVYYGETPCKELGPIQKHRDELEFRTFDEAIKTNLPILGICRGVQLINCALGGALYQDIPTEYETKILHRQAEGELEPSHSVNILEGTPLASLIGGEKMVANSFHHQAIKRLGAGLRVMARADDGMIEAVYLDGESYLRGYQWHPERLYQRDENNKKIFEDFISAARKRRT